MEFLSIPFVVCLVLTFVLYYMRTGAAVGNMACCSWPVVCL